MSNEIRIQVPGEQITRGEPLSVPVTVALDRPLKVRGIHARFQGAEETRAVYTITTVGAKGIPQTQTHTATEHVDITTQQFLLSGNDRLGFFGNVSDAIATMFGGGHHEELPPGEHAFDIELSIPPGAPATHEGKKTRVFYELTVRVDVPLAIDLKAKQSFSVAAESTAGHETAPVRTRYPDDAGRGLIDSLFGPGVQIELALAADRFRPGETIEGTVLTETDKPLDCRSIHVRLIGIENSQAKGHSDRHVHQCDAVEVSTPGLLSGVDRQEFSLPARTDGLVTARGKLFSIEWFVQVEFDVPWAKDPKIRAPIALLPGP